MKFVVISRPVPGVDRSAVQAAESEMVEALRDQGFFDQIYLRSDREGAVSIVDSTSAEAVRAALAELPLSRAGCIEIVDVVAVEPRW